MRNNRWILLILGLCFGLRLVFFLAVQPWQDDVQREVIVTSDADGYHRLACVMLDYQRFALSPHGPLETLRTPIYPWYISKIYSLFGRRPWVVLLSQILLDTLSAYILFKAASRIVGRRAGLWTSAIYVLEPFGILYSCMLYSESLFAFLCIAALLLLSHCMGKRLTFLRVGFAGLAAAMFGLAALTRPIAIWAVVVIVLAFWWKLRHRLKEFSVYTLAFAFVFGITLLPWALRNWMQFATPRVSTSGDYNLLVLQAAAVKSKKERRSVEDCKDRLLRTAQKRAIADGHLPRLMNPFRMGDYQRKLAWEILSENKGTLLKETLRGIGFQMANLGTGSYANILRWERQDSEFAPRDISPSTIRQWFFRKSSKEIVLGLGVVVYLSLVYMSLLVGLVVSWKRGNMLLLAVCLMLALYFIILPGAAGLGRFKLAALPFYSVLAGAGAAWLQQRVFSRRGRRPVKAVLSE